MLVKMTKSLDHETQVTVINNAALFMSLSGRKCMPDRMIVGVKVVQGPAVQNLMKLLANMA